MNPNVSLILNSKDLLPVGKRSWFLTESSCNQGLEEDRVLLLSACDQGQFTCDNGECIDIVNRCDGVTQCNDQSDEKACILAFANPENYLKGKTPPSKADTLSVEVSSQVWVILDIREVAQVIKLKFELSMRWLDSRLLFYNLKDNEKMNSMLFEEKQQIWVPILIFQNTEKELTSLNDEKSSISVRKIKNGTFNVDGLISEDIDIYEGSENLITMSRVYDIEFLCDFKMHWYPFDTQTCYMEFRLKEEMDSFIDLIPGSEEYLGPKEFTQYFVRKIEISKYQRL